MLSYDVLVLPPVSHAIIVLLSRALKRNLRKTMRHVVISAEADMLLGQSEDV